MADREHAADQAEYSTEAVRWARGKRRRRRVWSGAAAETGCGVVGRENGAAGRGRRRRRRGRDELNDGGWRGRAGLSDGGEIEDEQNRRSIYIGRDPLVPTGNTSRD